MGGERNIGYQEKFLQVRTTDEVRRRTKLNALAFSSNLLQIQTGL